MKRAYATAMLLIAGCSPLLAQSPEANPAPPATNPAPPKSGPRNGQQPVLLDSVIAIINGSVLLQSDVDQEMRFSVLLPPGPNTPAAAGDRLIDRTLILEEMKEQQQPITVSDADVQKSLDELRRVLPACAHGRCIPDAGWRQFLAANHLSEEEVNAHWRLRLAILQYIELRFRAGIRISREQVNSYYQKSLLPEFEKVHEKPPTVASLTPRIREILLQQQVNLLLGDWLKSLREQGSVQILNPVYGQSSGDSDSAGGSE